MLQISSPNLSDLNNIT